MKYTFYLIALFSFSLYAGNKDSRYNNNSEEEFNSLSDMLRAQWAAQSQRPNINESWAPRYDPKREEDLARFRAIYAARSQLCTASNNTAATEKPVRPRALTAAEKEAAHDQELRNQLPKIPERLNLTLALEFFKGNELLAQCDYTFAQNHLYHEADLQCTQTHGKPYYPVSCKNIEVDWKKKVARIQCALRNIPSPVVIKLDDSTTLADETSGITIKARTSSAHPISTALSQSTQTLAHPKKLSFSVELLNEDHGTFCAKKWHYLLSGDKFELSSTDTEIPNISNNPISTDNAQKQTPPSIYSIALALLKLETSARGERKATVEYSITETSSQAYKLIQAPTSTTFKLHAASLNGHREALHCDDKTILLYIRTKAD